MSYIIKKRIVLNSGKTFTQGNLKQYDDFKKARDAFDSLVMYTNQEAVLYEATSEDNVIFYKKGTLELDPMQREA